MAKGRHFTGRITQLQDAQGSAVVSAPAKYGAAAKDVTVNVRGGLCCGRQHDDVAGSPCGCLPDACTQPDEVLDSAGLVQVSLHCYHSHEGGGWQALFSCPFIVTRAV